MSVGAAIPRQHAAFGSADSRGWRTLSDLAMVVVIAPVSRAAGFTLNRLFIAAAAGRLQEPEQRFDKELTTLVSAAPLAIALAATVLQSNSQTTSAVNSTSKLGTGLISPSVA